jgi:hypothetical protein
LVRISQGFAAVQDFSPAYGSNGSKADVTLSIRDVRFTPNSGHSPVAI